MNKWFTLIVICLFTVGIVEAKQTKGFQTAEISAAKTAVAIAHQEDKEYIDLSLQIEDSIKEAIANGQYTTAFRVNNYSDKAIKKVIDALFQLGYWVEPTNSGKHNEWHYIDIQWKR
jgi:hypothetical protein